MKIAIFSDPHLGYARFEEDSYKNAAEVIRHASEEADLIICAGDVFDVKIPKLETLKKAVEIFKSAKKPVVAIFGNHERRAKGYVNPLQLIADAVGIRLLHGESIIFEKDGERVQIIGMGSVPDEFAEEALKKVLERCALEDCKKILVLHQTIKDFVPGGEGLSLAFLTTLPFDLIINGHIHERIEKGHILLPGSTVITQLKKSETAPKGYYLYDTKEGRYVFREVPMRKFYYKELKFENASPSEVRARVEALISELKSKEPTCIISIKLEGTLEEGATLGAMPKAEDVFIENRLNARNLKERIASIKELREGKDIRQSGLKALYEKVRGKVSFDHEVLFERLVEGPDEALEYLLEQG